MHDRRTNHVRSDVHEGCRDPPSDASHILYQGHSEMQLDKLKATGRTAEIRVGRRVGRFRARQHFALIRLERIYSATRDVSVALRSTRPSIVHTR